MKPKTKAAKTNRLGSESTLSVRLKLLITPNRTYSSECERLTQALHTAAHPRTQPIVHALLIHHSRTTASLHPPPE